MSYQQTDKTLAFLNGITTTETTKNGATYNLAGQRVSKSYKGIVIVNGKKHIQ